ncbi:MAG: scaffolding protein [Pirellulales bacterium]
MPTVDELYNEAEQLKEAGKLDEAAAKFEETVTQDPSFVLGHTALSVLYTRMGKSEQAIAHGIKACELEPNEAFNFTSLSVTFMRAGKIPEAEDAMARSRMLQQGR